MRLPKPLASRRVGPRLIYEKGFEIIRGSTGRLPASASGFRFRLPFRFGVLVGSGSGFRSRGFRFRVGATTSSYEGSMSPCSCTEFHAQRRPSQIVKVFRPALDSTNLEATSSSYKASNLSCSCQLNWKLQADSIRSTKARSIRMFV